MIAAGPKPLTDDATQLAYERQRLADARAKRDGARDEGDRVYYAACVQGWQRSITVLERRVEEQNNG